MTDITLLLQAAGSGDAQAAERVVALLYADLQRLAHGRLRRSGNLTLLDTTSLVHESYLRMQRSGELSFPDRKHFLAYAARVMHAIVIDIVRARRAERHGGDAMHITLNTEIGESISRPDDEVLRVHEALQELAAAEPRLAQVVEMRYFGGLSEAEVAEALGLTERTVQRDWQKARLFLAVALK